VPDASGLPANSGSGAASGLVGRDVERARLSSLLALASEGQSGVLALVGEPGAGKSSLLDQIEVDASGFTILRAAGSEMEQGLAFAALANLIRPMIARLDALPAVQRDALRSALAIGESQLVDRFAAYVAVLGLISAESEHGPLLLLVDDLHWLDPASAEAILFVSKRLAAERALVVLATRDEGRELLRDIPTLELRGVGPDDVVALVLDRTGQSISRAVSMQLHLQTAGNPLALIEASRILDAEQRVGRRALPDPIPVGRQLVDSFARRLTALPARTRRALVIASACDTESLEPLAAALAKHDLELADLEPAEDEGLVKTVDAHLRFTHPLVRSSAYFGASAKARRSAHRALAEVSTGPLRSDARAWHLVAAAARPDETVALEIEKLAFAARARQAPAISHRAFEAAARLTPDPERASARLLEAAFDAEQAGRIAEALALASAARRNTHDRTVVGRAQQLEGRVGFWSGVPGSVELLVQAAYELAGFDESLGGAVLAEAAMMANFESLAAGQRLVSMPLFQKAPEFLRIVAETSAATFSAQRPWARAVLLAMWPQIRELDPLANPWISSAFGRGLISLEHWDQARELYESIISAARASSNLSALPIALTSLGEVDFRQDRWWNAYALCDEALRIADDTGGFRSFCLVNLAIIEGAQGRITDCRAHSNEAIAIGLATGNRVLQTWAQWALGLLEFGYGRHLSALEQFERRQALMLAGGQITPPLWQLELAETLIISGRSAEAHQILDELPAEEMSAQVDLQARLERCLALAAVGGDAEPHFHHSIDLAADFAFERARTYLAFAQWLRRNRRRADAISHLRSASAIFLTLSATGWSDQVELEIRAAGGKVPDSTARNSLSSLTARELQVATAVASGASNREIAQSLFVSEKTVESHLSSSFHKLSIRSRLELARVLYLDGIAP
jgi:DNA-binding CsgD family transcriptional regulator/tetratricopeptide (TPR) repeat protein